MWSRRFVTWAAACVWRPNTLCQEVQFGWRAAWRGGARWAGTMDKWVGEPHQTSLLSCIIHHCTSSEWKQERTDTPHPSLRCSPSAGEKTSGSAIPCTPRKSALTPSPTTARSLCTTATAWRATNSGATGRYVTTATLAFLLHRNVTGSPLLCLVSCRTRVCITQWATAASTAAPKRAGCSWTRAIPPPPASSGCLRGPMARCWSTSTMGQTKAPHPPSPDPKSNTVAANNLLLWNDCFYRDSEQPWRETPAPQGQVNRESEQSMMGTNWGRLVKHISHRK